MRTVQIIVKGKVQGVFFRATAKKIAEELGVSGTVRNLPDDNVEIIASGDHEQIEAMIRWAKQGPSQAEVSEVIVTEMEGGRFGGFRIVRS